MYTQPYISSKEPTSCGIIDLCNKCEVLAIFYNRWKRSAEIQRGIIASMTSSLTPFFTFPHILHTFCLYFWNLVRVTLKRWIRAHCDIHFSQFFTYSFDPFTCLKNKRFRDPRLDSSKPNAVILNEREYLFSEVHKCLAWVFHHLTGLIWGHILDIYSPPPFHFHDFLSSSLSQFTRSLRLQALPVPSESLIAAY